MKFTKFLKTSVLKNISANDFFIVVFLNLTQLSLKSNQFILEKKFNANLSSEDKSLRHKYWIPKLQKQPTESRFITAAPKCSVKTLSKALTSILRSLFNQINACNDKCPFFCCEDLWSSFKHSPCNRSNQETKIILIREEKQNQSRSSYGRCSVKKGALWNFAKFTGKHLPQILFFNEVAGGAYVIPTYTLLAPIRNKSGKTQNLFLIFFSLWKV